MRKKRLLSRVVLGLLMFMSVSAAAWGEQVVLPYWGATIDGIPVSQRHDDFYGYSADLLSELTGDDSYIDATGLGKLAIVVASGPQTSNSGQQAVQGGTPGTTFSFEDSIENTNAQLNPFTTTWGNHPDRDGPVLVDTLVAYLRSFDPNAVSPVFGFDLNQRGDEGSVNLTLLGKVSIYDPVNNQEVGAWYLDDGGTDGNGANVLTGGNNTWDTDNWVTAIGGTQTVIGASGTSYTFSGNIGSGKPDFFAYVPTMDLTQYAKKDYWFVGNFGLGAPTGDFGTTILNNDGNEEVFILGAYSVTPVPEPSALVGLCGLGAVGLIAGWRRRKRAA